MRRVDGVFLVLIELTRRFGSAALALLSGPRVSRYGNGVATFVRVGDLRAWAVEADDGGVDGLPVSEFHPGSIAVSLDARDARAVALDHFRAEERLGDAAIRRSPFRRAFSVSLILALS